MEIPLVLSPKAGGAVEVTPVLTALMRRWGDSACHPSLGQPSTHQPLHRHRCSRQQCVLCVGLCELLLVGCCFLLSPMPLPAQLLRRQLLRRWQLSLSCPLAHHLSLTQLSTYHFLQFQGRSKQQGGWWSTYHLLQVHRCSRQQAAGSRQRKQLNGWIRRCDTGGCDTGWLMTGTLTTTGSRGRRGGRCGGGGRLDGPCTRGPPCCLLPTDSTTG